MPQGALFVGRASPHDVFRRARTLTLRRELDALTGTRQTEVARRTTKLVLFATSHGVEDSAELVARLVVEPGLQSGLAGLQRDCEDDGRVARGDEL